MRLTVPRRLATLLAALLLTTAAEAQIGGGPISGGGGGSSGPATSVQGSATLPGTCTEKDLYQDTNAGGTELYVCTATNTWTKAGTGDGTIGGSTGATDDAILIADGTGGSTLAASAATLTAAGSMTIPTGQTINIPAGTKSAPAITSPDADTGFFFGVAYDSKALVFSRDGAGHFSLSLYGATRYVNLTSDSQIIWQNVNTVDSGAADIGLSRFAAGVLKGTDSDVGVRFLQGGGTAVASATAMPLPTGRVFHVTGTTAITSITSTNFQSGVCVTLIFDDVLTFTDGSNLKLAGNFTTSADDTISLCYDGSNWFETGRSAN